MLKEERHQKILMLLRDTGKIVAGDLSQVLETSEDTIRRDLREMDKAGLLLRVHGGALPRPTAPAAYVARVAQDTASKDAIATVTVKQLRNGQIIFFDSGTTVLKVAQHLPEDLQITAVTSSIPVMAALAHHPSVEVVVLGGRLFKNGQIALGAQTVAAVRAIHADVCILGVCAIHPEIGVTGLDYEEAALKQSLVEASNQVIAVADSDKLRTVAPFAVATLDRINILVTTPEVPEATLSAYRAHGITVITE